MERTDLSWKLRAEVELSKFKRSFPTSVGSFQLRLTLSNFSKTFQLQTFQLKTLESFKLESLELESSAEVGKSQAKLERTERSWKEPIGVGKNRLKLERTDRS